MALTQKDILHLGEALGSAAAAKELIACIATHSYPSKKTELILASALCDNLWKKYGTATWELLNSITTGQTMSLKTQRKIVLTLASPTLANRLINLIQTSPSPLVRL